MTTYNLPTEYNQQITIVADGASYTFLLRYFRDMMYVSIADADGTNLVTNVRACDRQWLVPWKRFASLGNFRFEDDEGEYPVCTRFETHCVLRYYTADEIGEMSA